MLAGAALASVALAVDPATAATPALVDRTLAHWWVFPAAVAFSTVAIGSGVSGALFFSPFFMLVVGLTPSQAIGAGLLTEVFGMGNGLRSYVRQEVVDWATARWLLLFAVPTVIAGALAAHVVPADALRLAFGGGLVLLGGFMVVYPAPERCEPGAEADDADEDDVVTVVEAADGETYRYATCGRGPGGALAAVGGFLTGLISAGLPEITTSQLVLRCRVPPRVAVATSVVVLAITAAVGATIHAASATPVWHVVAWSVPGVVVGSTVGSRFGKHLPDDLMETGLGAVFALVGGVVLAVELVP